MMPFVPNATVEVANGIVSVLLLWMVAFGSIHLVRLYLSYLSRYRGRYGQWRALAAMYQNNKPSIALISFFFGLWVRQSMFWYFRVVQDHHWHVDNIISENGPQITIITTTIMIVGAACWIRVISPLSHGWDALIWFLMVGSALAVGIGVALA